MAFSIESRVPFLTKEFAELIFQLPDEYIISPDCISKHVFRESMRQIVPDESLNRKDKIGFETSEKAWMESSHNWIKSILSDKILEENPVLNASIISKLLNTKNNIPNINYNIIWRWINFITWSKIFNVTFT